MTEPVTDRVGWVSVTMVVVTSDGRFSTHHVWLTGVPDGVEHPLWKKGMQILGDAVLKDLNEKEDR